MNVVHSNEAVKSALCIGYINNDVRTVIGSPYLLGRDGTVKECQLLYRTFLWKGIQERGEVYFELRRIERALAINPEFQFHAKRAWHVPVIRAALGWLKTQENDMPVDIQPMRQWKKSNRQLSIKFA